MKTIATDSNKLLQAKSFAGSIWPVDIAQDKEAIGRKRGGFCLDV